MQSVREGETYLPIGKIEGCTDMYKYLAISVFGVHHFADIGYLDHLVSCFSISNRRKTVKYEIYLFSVESSNFH